MYLHRYLYVNRSYIPSPNWISIVEGETRKLMEMKRNEGDLLDIQCVISAESLSMETMSSTSTCHKSITPAIFVKGMGLYLMSEESVIFVLSLQ